MPKSPQVSPKARKPPQPPPPKTHGTPARLADHPTLSTSQAAALLGVSHNTVRRLADEGVLPSWRVPHVSGEPGYRRFNRSDVEALKEGSSTTA